MEPSMRTLTRLTSSIQGLTRSLGLGSLQNARCPRATMLGRHVAVAFSFLCAGLLQASPRPGGDYQDTPEAASVIRHSTNGTETFVRIRDDTTVPRMIIRRGDESAAETSAPLDTICDVNALAVYGQNVPRTRGGTLDPVAFFNSTTINSSGSIAFNALVNGSTRNQGVFVADSARHLTAIAIGC